MVRTVGSTRDKTWPLIRQAGVELLFEHGYENMNTRQLAARVNLKPGSLYYYFDSKEELLHRLVMELLQDIVDDLVDRLDGVEDPVDRLHVYIATLVKWHVDHNKESFIARMEIRSLSVAKLETYMGLRDRFDIVLDEILLAGHKSGAFVADPKHLIRISVLTMITGITGWYHADGPSRREELTTFYCQLVEKLTGPTSSAEG